MSKANTDSEYKYAQILEEATLKARLKEIRAPRNAELDRRADVVLTYIFGLIAFMFMWIGSMLILAQGAVMIIFLHNPDPNLAVTILFSGIIVQGMSWWMLGQSVNHLHQLKKPKAS